MTPATFPIGGLLFQVGPKKEPRQTTRGGKRGGKGSSTNGRRFKKSGPGTAKLWTGWFLGDTKREGKGSRDSNSGKRDGRWGSVPWKGCLFMRPWGGRIERQKRSNGIWHLKSREPGKMASAKKDVQEKVGRITNQPLQGVWWPPHPRGG